MRVWIVAIALALAAQGAGPQANPVTNGGFEEVDAQGRPVDWEILGTGTVDAAAAHTGARGLRLVRTREGGEVGLNRRWTPGSHARGAMLAQVHGGIRFWYRAVAAEPKESLTVQVIPMSDRPQEFGGGRVVWRVPPSHVDDGRWHHGALAYDFRANPEVRWVHVGARLLGERGELWLDDVEWVEQVGPVLQIEAVTLSETEGAAGRAATARVTVRNVGDAPTAEGESRIRVPAGLRAGASSGAAAGVEAEAPLPAIGPGEAAVVAWSVVGTRDQVGKKIEVMARSGTQTAEADLQLKTDITTARLRCERLLLRPGESVRVAVLAHNEGNAIARGVRASLVVPSGFDATLLRGSADVPPGATGPVGEWRLRARVASPRAVLIGWVSGAGQARSFVVVARNLPGPLSATGATYAAVSGARAMVGSAKARVLLARNGTGWGPAALQARSVDGWRTVATLPYLGLLATADGDHVLAPGTATPSRSASAARLALEGSVLANGRRWKTRWELSARAGDDVIGYALTATPLAARSEAPARVLALEGPMLYAGAAGGPSRDDAVVPGLEWLVRGEESSNALDFTPDHPDRERYVPHPYKVTVPAVGMRFGSTAVGLLWDVPARQPSSAPAGPLSLVFGSPDRWEGHASHLAGLFLPAVGKWVPENERRARTPLAAPAGRPLVIRAGLLAAPGARDSLVALDRWFARDGYPMPLPYPRGSARGEVAFSLRAYFKDRALWNPKWGRWYTDLIVGFQPTDAPALDLLRGARFLGSGAVSDRARRLAAEVLKGDARTLALALQHRADPSGLRGAAREARALIASQHADGTWRFTGKGAGTGAPYEFLGPVGASEVGLTAQKATTVLGYASLSGDRSAADAGLRALRAMRRFRVPRAAQVWEVPVHTPDVLASAQAVDAYVAGYRLTDDRAWLADAVYWARTGLPFVYVWSAPGLPAMHGASIPVFGATSYALSWTGVAVQWNGLAYASALLDLAKLDRSFPWGRVAESLLRSAMYQQATQGDRLGQWPDAMNFIAGRPGLHGQTPPCFQPASILDLLWRTRGLHPRPEVRVARGAGGRAAVRAAADIERVAFARGGVRFSVAYAPKEAGAAEVIGVTRPRSVIVDGRPVPFRPDVWLRDEAGWSWHAGERVVEVRFTRGGSHRVTVEGVRPQAPPAAPKPRVSLAFDFARGADGWYAAHDLAPLRAGPDGIVTRVTGADPYLVREDLAVPGRAGDVLVIRLAADGGPPGGSVFWGTSATPGFAPTRELPFAFRPDDSLHEVRIPVGDSSSWAGQTVTSLRIDPGGGSTGAALRVASVRLERARGRQQGR